jgi:hypothetical protein
VRLAATFTVEGAEPVYLTTRPVDVVRWEASTRKKITDGVGFAEMTRILWEAARRNGVLAPEHATDYDAWVAALADCQIEAATSAPPPPDAEQSAG